eukprot:gene3458-4299_t
MQTGYAFANSSVKRRVDARAPSPHAPAHWEGNAMDFTLSAEQVAIREQISRICADFPDDYWLARDRDAVF